MLWFKWQYFTEILCLKSVWTAPSSWVLAGPDFMLTHVPYFSLGPVYAHGNERLCPIDLLLQHNVATRVGELNWNKQKITLLRCLRYFINCTSLQNIPGTQHPGFHRCGLFYLVCQPKTICLFVFPCVEDVSSQMQRRAGMTISCLLLLNVYKKHSLWFDLVLLWE